MKILKNKKIKSRKNDTIGSHQNIHNYKES